MRTADSKLLTIGPLVNLSLKTVAKACGYDSASHLSRHVKRVTGQSPGALRGRG